MHPFQVILTCLLIVFGYYLYLVVYRFYFHPLARFPGPWLAGATYWYDFFYDCLASGGYGRSVFNIEALHDRYGPIVRITPDEIAIRDPEWYDVLFNSGRRDKALRNYAALGSPGSIAQTIDHEMHKIRRAPMSPSFSKRSIMNFEPTIKTKVEQLSGGFDTHYQERETLSIGNAFTAFALDTVCEHSFGQTWDCLQTADFGAQWKDILSILLCSLPILKHIPWLLQYLDVLIGTRWDALNPNFGAYTGVRKLITSQLRRLIANKQSRQDKSQSDYQSSTVFDAVLQSDLPDQEKTESRVSDEAFALVIAGSEITASALTNLIYHLLANPSTLHKVQAELDAAMPNPSAIADWCDLERSPYFHASIKETLRIGSLITNRSQLVVREENLMYNDWHIPAGTIVSMSISAIHLQKDIFDNPHEFRPERWLGKEGKGLDKYFLPFSRGSRGCIGQNLAYCEIHLAAAAILRRFDMELFDTVRERDVDGLLRLILRPVNRHAAISKTADHALTACTIVTQDSLIHNYSKAMDHLEQIGLDLVVRQNINGPGRQIRATEWRVADIIYVAIVGTVMLAAFLEWILWLMAFLYCLIKVFQKAENVSIRVLSGIMMVLFTLLRAIFLPVMIVTLPLPPQLSQEFPNDMVIFLQWFAFWTFAGLLTVPWLICVFQLVTHSVGRTRRIKHILNERSAPKVVIVMPCYKEVPEILLRTVDSLVDCEYPPSCLHVFLSFDGDQEDDLYLNTIEKLGVPMTLKTYPRSIDVVYRSTRITVSRFPHGGKRHCQKQTFRLIDKIYATYVKHHDDLFVLFIDSDCILDKVCIQNFMYEMELKPGSERNMLAMTGVITSTTEKNSLITILQDMEYIHGQLFERSVESGCGAVTCLPGALTILRFSAFRKMAKYYFADKAEQCDDLFDYGKCHLGEDRWLTHLFMIGAKKRYQIQMNTGAFCKTEAVQTFRSLLKQRRRWFLGFITNEVCMLTDIRLWKQYPVLCIVRFAQNTIRTTALLFFIMVISLITTSQKVAQLPVGFIAVSLGLNWGLMLYFAAKLGRFKIMLYPIMFVLNPFFNWLYMIYGIFTAGQRTWGGPRADAGAADAKTTPGAAIEHAEATGDDLNVIPETFKPAVESVTRQKSRKTTVQPPDRVEGRFASSHPDGFARLQHDEESGIPDLQSDQTSAPQSCRHSAESYLTTNTRDRYSIVTPRRVESFINANDALAYYDAQASQAAPGGAAFETHHERGDLGIARDMSKAIVRSSTMPARTTRPSRPRIQPSYSSSSAWSSEASSPEGLPRSFNPFAPSDRAGTYMPVSSASVNETVITSGPIGWNDTDGVNDPRELRPRRLRAGEAVEMKQVSRSTPIPSANSRIEVDDPTSSEPQSSKTRDSGKGKGRERTVLSPAEIRARGQASAQAAYTSDPEGARKPDGGPRTETKTLRSMSAFSGNLRDGSRGMGHTASIRDLQRAKPRNRTADDRKDNRPRRFFGRARRQKQDGVRAGGGSRDAGGGHRGRATASVDKESGHGRGRSGRRKLSKTRPPPPPPPPPPPHV
ncbi:Chitin synthase D-like protein [Elsinoe fawcettii]|nr:Chitin synthase D-like protein [Elsinoe fawcettii]